MPSKNADKLIVDINLSSVKVQNWDNSVTMIPIDTMVTDSLTNWRRMKQGPGWLFVRSFHVSTESVKFADEVLLDFLSKNLVTATNFAEGLSLAQLSSPGETLTNLALGLISNYSCVNIQRLMIIRCYLYGTCTRFPAQALVSRFMLFCVRKRPAGMISFTAR